MKYSVIAADPPWQYGDRKGPANKTAQKGTPGGFGGTAPRYEDLSLSGLMSLPVAELTKKKCHLYLWCTNAFIEEAHLLAKAWGFDPKTVLTWVKVKADGKTPSMKMGHYYRGATEHCLFATKGRKKLIEGAPTRPTAFLSPRLPHSVKPDWFYDLVEEQSSGNRLELFSRREREGWDGWGHEYPGKSRGLG